LSRNSFFSPQDVVEGFMLPNLFATIQRLIDPVE
jgi:hypothetical protein